MGEDRRIDVELGVRLGQVITPDAIETEPLHQEQRQILEAASPAIFRAQDDTWRSVRGLSSKEYGNEEESLRCHFAPDSALLHRDYRDESLDFFAVARRGSRIWTKGFRFCAHGSMSPTMSLDDALFFDISYAEGKDRSWRKSFGKIFQPGWRTFWSDSHLTHYSKAGKTRNRRNSSLNSTQPDSKALQLRPILVRTNPRRRTMLR